ncbi:MAG: radical SAM protein, partial [Candidatus Margulisbacteria bacterium]|nr:radical SAM protein [Candidatus Margulisiibacteriota bacterium]
MSRNTVFIETYGCQMNVYDTELVKTILKKANYTLVQDEESADIVMLNTCSVRDNANRKIFNRVHTIKNMRPKNAPLVGILGCMATNFKTELLSNHKLKIDFIAGPDSYKQLPTLIAATQETGQKQFDVTLSEFETYSDVFPTREGGVNAWLAVMRGCNNYCTFCVVPYTRGRERSRDPQNIVEEVKRLVTMGVSQVTLLGQNVNSYRYESHDFADLM